MTKIGSAIIRTSVGIMIEESQSGVDRAYLSCIEVYYSTHESREVRIPPVQVHEFGSVHSTGFSHKHIAVQQYKTVKQTRKRLP